jgi:hypothetical protein
VSDFKTGDRITVTGPTSATERFFLAEFQGNVYYVRGDNSRTAFGVSPERVSAYVPPFPFKVGDRIRMRKTSSGIRHIVYTVMAVEGDMVHLAFYDKGVVRPASSEVRFAADWEIASDTDTATPPALRDRSGDVWRPTGRRSDSGEAYYSLRGNVDNKTTRARLINAGYGPLTEVAG